MRKIFVCVLFLIGLTAMDLHAELDTTRRCSLPCNPDNPWTYVVEADTLPGMCDSCYLLLHYWWRSCNGTPQAYLAGIETSGKCDSNVCLSWALSWATRRVADNNPRSQQIKVALPLDSCWTNIQVGASSCYKWILVKDPTNALRHTVPCDTTNCCTYVFEICKSKDGVCSIIQTNSPYTSVDCPAKKANCLNFCDYQALPRMMVQDDRASEDKDEGNPKITFISSHGDLFMSVNSQKQLEYEILVTDVLGRIVYHNTINADVGDTVQRIPIPPTRTATFTYMIRSLDKVVKSGKIFVVN